MSGRAVVRLAGASLVLLLAAWLPPRAPAEAGTVTARLGRVTATADQTQAFPGGLVVVHLRSTRRLGGVQYAVLGGRRFPFFGARGGRRALVAVPTDFTPGRHRLGIELRTARGRQRFALYVEVGERAYHERAISLPEAKRPLAIAADAVRDGRRVQLLLRTASAEQLWHGPFAPPVGADPADSFGARTSYSGAHPVEAVTDAIHGEYHRGLDYDVTPGTAVRAPAHGAVLMAAELAATGRTVVVDHGQTLVSVFFHLDRLDVVPGQTVAQGMPLGLSGESGLAAGPHLHWGLYVMGVPVDPRVALSLAD